MSVQDSLKIFQASAVKKIMDDFNKEAEATEGKVRKIILAPTGAGKTYIMAALTQEFISSDLTVLIVPHSKKMAFQIYEKFRGFFGDDVMGPDQISQGVSRLAAILVINPHALDKQSEGLNANLKRMLKDVKKFVVPPDECFCRMEIAVFGVATGRTRKGAAKLLRGKSFHTDKVSVA